MADFHDLHEAGGFSLQTVDGSNVEDVLVERVTITHPRGAISLRRGARGRGQTPARPGVLRDIVVRDVTVTSAREPSSIAGLPEWPVERVTFARVRFEMMGNGSHDGAPVPELPDAYPQNTMFGALPASVLYARHVDGLTLDDVSSVFAAPDARPLYVFDDVELQNTLM
jgi:hypothetical protein